MFRKMEESDVDTEDVQMNGYHIFYAADQDPDDPDQDGTNMLTENGYKPVQKVGVVKRRSMCHEELLVKLFSEGKIQLDFLKKMRSSKDISTEPRTNKQFAMNRLSSKKGNKQWVHPPEALLRGHIVYNVKFLGHVEVEQPKGTDVVKEAIRKMKFNKQLRKAEGQKLPKVELTVSVDGVTIQDPKHKIVQHQHSLHRISYCADDKTDKKMFTFIAKDGANNKHHCYVFDSDKCAEEITLTIGQAFDLAYRKFMESSSKDMDTKKQFLLMQKKVHQLTDENLKLKVRVADLERLLDPTLLENFDKNKNNIIKTTSTSPTSPAPVKDNPVVGRRLENLILEEPSTPYTNGNTNDTAVYARVQRTHPTAQPQSPVQGTPVLAPPPPVPSRSNPPTPATPSQKTPAAQVDLFGATPFVADTPPRPVPAIPPRTPQSLQLAQDPFSIAPPPGKHGASDPFGMGSFDPASTPQDLDQQIMDVDKELMDLQTGFSQGISFGTDFSLADLDPLNQK